MSNPTYPHDYRVIASSDARPVFVGGQAVSLWAITFLEDKTPLLSTKYASADLDILSGPRVLEFLSNLGPNWRFESTPFWKFGDGREGVAYGVTPDHRKLLVEVLKSVHGLDAQELKSIVELEYAGVTYRVLDPIVLLKSKAANVRDFPQDGTPPRHDRVHLQLVARCWPLYLKQLHADSLGKTAAEQKALAANFSRAFETLKHQKTAGVLAAEGIDRTALMPAEFAESPIAAVRNAYKFQMPRIGG